MITLQNWKNELSHIDWPEITELIKEIDARVWEEQKADYTHIKYLVGYKNDSDVALIHRTDAVFAPGMPEYLGTLSELQLVEIKRENVKENLMHAGGIADVAGFYTEQGHAITEEDWRDHPEWYNYSQFENSKIDTSSTVYQFCTTPGGDMYFANNKGNVLGYKVNIGLTKIGTIEHFVRYQLRSILAGKNWYDDSFSQGVSFDDLDIKFIDGIYD